MSENAIHDIRMRCLELARTLVSPSVADAPGEVIKIARDLYERGILCNDVGNTRDTPKRGKRRGPRGSRQNGPSPDEDTPGNVIA
jgi:hypothetical protein